MKKLALVCYALLSLQLSYTQTDTNFTWFYERYDEDFPNSSVHTIERIQGIMDSVYEDTTLQTTEYGYKEYKRWCNFWVGRYGVTQEDIDSGRSPNFKTAGVKAASLLNTFSCTGNNGSNWTFLGPKSLPEVRSGISANPNGMGFISAVEHDFSDQTGNTFYAGSPSGGLWKTINGGDHWTNLTDNTSIPALGIGDIVIDPTDPQTIYIATETQRFIHRAYGVGVLKTTDGGQSWQTTGLSFNLGDQILDLAHSIVINPQNNQVLYALLENEIKRSTDAGATWTTVYTVPLVSAPQGNGGRRMLWDILYHPTDTTVMYATSRDGSHDSGGAVVVKSTDGGKTWSNITANIAFVNAKDRIDIAVTPQYPDRLYLVASRGGSKVFRSDDKGITWTVVSGNLTVHRGGFWRNEFEISPTDASVIYLGGVFLAKSTDGGATFYKITSRVEGVPRNMHDDIRAIQIISSSTPGTSGANDVVLVGHDGGVSKTTNGGEVSWNFVGGDLSVNEFWSFDLAKDHSYMLGGMQDQGFLRYDFNTDTWRNAGVHGDGGQVHINNNDQNQIIANIFPISRLRKSVDGGLSFVQLGRSVTEDVEAHDEISLSFEQQEDGTLYIAPRTALYKNNGTSNWESNWTKLGSLPVGGATEHLKRVKTAKADPNVIYAARGGAFFDNNCPGPSCTATGKLFRSDDKGQTWTDITAGLNPLTWAGISDIEVHPEDEDKVWVSFENFWTSMRVFYTDDGGATWSNFSDGLPDMPITTIVYQEGSNDRLFVGTDVGVYHRDEDMNQWECFSNNLPTAIVAKLKIGYCKGEMIAGTFGRSFWETPLPDVHFKQDRDFTKNHRVASNMIIESGVTLTVTGRLEMGENIKIIIKPGAKLDVIGGTITNTLCQDLFWDGIQVHGNRDKDQFPLFSPTHQGLLMLRNNALIENARYAIQCWDPGDYNTTGGLVIATNSTIKNTRRAVSFLTYKKINHSYFREVTFVNDANIHVVDQSGALFLPLVSIWDNKGIRFDGCEFSDLSNFNEYSDQNATGIFSIDAGYTVRGYCPVAPGSPLLPCAANEVRGLFQNLNKGIYAVNSASSRTVVVDRTDFVDNSISFHAKALDNIRFTRNNVITGGVLKTGYDDSNNDFDHQYGVLIERQSSDFEIEDNVFEGRTNPVYDVAGINIINAGSDANEVYRNEFKNTETGEIYEGPKPSRYEAFSRPTVPL